MLYAKELNSNLHFSTFFSGSTIMTRCVNLIAKIVSTTILQADYNRALLYKTVGTEKIRRFYDLTLYILNKSQMFQMSYQYVRIIILRYLKL